MQRQEDFLRAIRKVITQETERSRLPPLLLEEQIIQVVIDIDQKSAGKTPCCGFRRTAHSVSSTAKRERSRKVSSRHHELCYSTEPANGGGSLLTAGRRFLRACAKITWRNARSGSDQCSIPNAQFLSEQRKAARVRAVLIEAEAIRQSSLFSARMSTSKSGEIKELLAMMRIQTAVSLSSFCTIRIL